MCPTQPCPVRQKPTLNRFLFISILLLSSVCLVIPVHAAAASLDESTAIRLGLERPAVTDLLTARLDSVRGTVIDSGKWSNPEIQYAREGVNGLGGNGTENHFVLSQEVDFSGQLTLERAAAEKHLVAETLGTNTYRRLLIAEIRNRFYEVLRTQRAEEVVIEWMQELESLQGIIEKRVAAGDASRYQAQRVAQERTSGPVLLTEIRTQRTDASERLAALIGAEHLEPYDRISGDIMPARPEPLEHVLAVAEQRPDLRQLQERVAAYSLERDAAEKSAIPDVTLSMGVRNIHDDFNGDDHGLLLSAALPIPLFNRNEGSELRASGQARQANAEYRILLERVRGEVRAAHQRLTMLRSAVIDYRANAVKPANELKRLARYAYSAGEIGILELIDAYQTAFDAEKRALQLEMQSRRALIELNRQTGEVPQ